VTVVLGVLVVSQVGLLSASTSAGLTQLQVAMGVGVTVVLGVLVVSQVGLLSASTSAGLTQLQVAMRLGVMVVVGVQGTLPGRSRAGLLPTVMGGRQVPRQQVMRCKPYGKQGAGGASCV
jgi:hypothetical protein